MHGFVSRLLSALVVITLAGCGGGGSSVSGSAATVGSGSTTIISGVAASGLLYPGQVSIYRLLADGTEGAALAENIATNSRGEYLANIGVYTGPVLVKASGFYTDEATGARREISAATPLRAALASASGNMTVSVTPLTELAVRKAGAALTASAITGANALVSDLYKLDIISTRPVGFDASSVGSAPTQAVKDYTLALAALSQMSATAGTNQMQVVETIAADISDGTMSASTASSFTSALATVMNTAVIPQNVTSGLWGVGAKTYVLKLTVSGTADLITGVGIYVQVPAGVSLPTAADSNQIFGDYTKPSGTASGVTMFLPTFFPITQTNPVGEFRIAMADTTGFRAGEIATIRCNVAAGITPRVSDFRITYFKPDHNGSNMNLNNDTSNTNGPVFAALSFAP